LNIINNVNDNSLAESKGLRLITTSLFYLSQEAAEDGLDDVSKIILNAINQIEQWIKNDYNLDLSSVVMNEDTIAVLTILLKFSEMPMDKRAQTLAFLHQAEEEDDTEDAANLRVVRS